MFTAQRTCLAALSVIALATLTGVAQAHVGLGSTTGFWDGVIHPFGGLDHICAMLGVGLWASQRGGRSIWILPVAFLGVMIVGGLLGKAHVFIPFVEPAIIASVLVIGLVVATAMQLPLAASASLVALFALFHGHAHGAEMPDTAAGIAYGVGFLCSSVALLTGGIGLGRAARKMQLAWAFRYAGAAILTCGIGLCAIYFG
jgi:urease accessory protein